MALGILKKALSHPEINLFVAIFSSYGDGGKLFFDCKKRMENLKFIHLASTYFRLLGRIKHSVFLLNETITHIAIE